MPKRCQSKRKVSTKGSGLKQAATLEDIEIKPWLTCVLHHSACRGSAGLKYAVAQYFQLCGALRPSEVLQVVPCNFLQLGGRWYLDVKDNNFVKSPVGKIVPRKIPLNSEASALVERSALASSLTA